MIAMRFWMHARPFALIAVATFAPGLALLVAAGVPTSRAASLAGALAAFVAVVLGGLQVSLARLDASTSIDATATRVSVAMAFVAVAASAAAAMVGASPSFGVRAIFAGLLVTSIATTIRRGVERRKNRPRLAPGEDVVLEGFAQRRGADGSLRLSRDALTFVQANGRRTTLTLSEIRSVRLSLGVRFGFVIEGAGERERCYVADPLRWLSAFAALGVAR